MKSKTALALILILLLMLVAISAAVYVRQSQNNRRSAPAPLAAAPQPVIGYSGLVRIDASTFLVVHDTKWDAPGAHLGILVTEPKKTPVYTPLDADWGAEPANDLEAACPIPGRANEFLVTESSYRDGKFGRVFHIVLSQSVAGWSATVRGKIMLPQDTDDLEALACIASSSGHLTLLLGERGGSKRNPTGKVRWGTLDLATYRFQLLSEAPLLAPGTIAAGGSDVRTCADLYVDEQNQLWSVATHDPGNNGPFRSVVYQAGTVDANSAAPVQTLTETTATWTLDGVKVEALAASTVENSSMSVATDDENYDGIWRPLFLPPAASGG